MAFLKRLLLLPILLIVGALIVFYWFFLNTKPFSGEEKFQDFLITKGSGASLIGNNLQEKGIIKSALAFKVYIQFTGKSSKIQAGEYRLSPNMSVFEIVSQFSKGPLEIWVTIPEGLRREEIASRFAEALAKDELFVKEFLSLTEGLEGHLFPDTYLFPKDVSATAIVNRMTSVFDSKISGLSNETNLSVSELIVLASLIERETKTPGERPVVAGILFNRLDADWPLQVDATVQYVVANSRCGNQVDCAWWKPILKSDLEVNSTYNTYKFTGLPPEPIANPGFSSIKAAFNPEDSDYWYYLHDPKGNIYYGKTLEEHNENISKYLR